MRYRLDLSYDGSPFCGWQIQPDAPSVQGALEEALEKILRCKTPVTGAGRTDTGVSASEYVAHFDYESAMDSSDLKYKLNAILPKAIAIKDICPVADDFHARFGALRREYTYYLHRTKDPFVSDHSLYYAYPDVDFEKMNSAAQALLGTHDYSCFEKIGGDNLNSNCEVFQAYWKQSDKGPDYWEFHIAANRFLRNMVRAIVGTLLEVGRGKRTKEDFESLVLNPSETKECRRNLAGESVPGYALFLSGVKY